MRKKIFILTLAMLCLPLLAFAQARLRINNQEANDGQSINLFYADLEAGKISFALGADKLTKAEISFDRGRSWQVMEKEADYFVLAYRPAGDETIQPEFLLTSEASGIQTYKPNVQINYQRKNPEESIEQILEKMQLYYEQESKDRFLSLFSGSFPDRVKFEESIQNDFYNYNNLRLRYRIDRRTFDTDYQGAIWDVYWERKYDTRSGSSSSDAATISMRLDKEGTGWLISGFRNNTIFGSSLLSSPDLKIADSDISLSSVYDGGTLTHKITINVNVHNNGSGTANNVLVKYYKKRSGVDTDYVDISSDKTITSINANSTGSPTSVVYDTGVGAAGVIFSIKVEVDPNGTIIEDDETNNSATKSVTTSF
jgi:hypothetical protein